MIKGLHVRAGYRRAAAGVVGCLLVGGALGAPAEPKASLPGASESAPTVELQAPPTLDETLASEANVSPDQALVTLNDRLRYKLMTEAFVLPALSQYTVQTGDSIWSIAEGNDTNTGTLLHLNPRVNPDVLQPGQTLTIVKGFHGIAYKVQEDDTVAAIASAYDIPVEEITAYNRVSTDAQLKEGSLLFLPGARPREASNLVASRSGSTRAARPAAAEAVARSESAAAAAPAPAPAPAQKQAPKQKAPAKAASGSGGWTWPIQGGMHSSEFGPRWGSFHPGLDIAAPAGTPAVAARAGTVVFAGWDGNYGYCVMLDHGDGIKTRYAHASAVLVQVGQSVGQGAPVIKVGNTGYSTGPHLHFEVIVNGKPQNPRNFLP